jgi:ferredoxin-NADP reductase
MSDHVGLPDRFVLTVQSVIAATPTTRIVRLGLDDAAFSFQAGQAAFLGPIEHDTRIPYSIASAPLESKATNALDFLIKVEGTGKWGQRFDVLRPGMHMGVQGPFGSFVLPATTEEQHFLFIAGGTGIAPIRSMIREAQLRGQGGRMRLLYSARTYEELAFLTELGESAARHQLDLRLHLTRAAPDASVSNAERGRITSAQLATLIDDPATLCFVCGPGAMVADVPRMLVELGIERARVRVEEG